MRLDASRVPPRVPSWCVVGGPMGRFDRMGDNTFVAGQEPWLERLGNLRNVVRQEMVTRQLAAHLPRGPLRVLDVGAGQGTQALRLARLGHSVTAVEPDGRMRAAFEQAAAGLTPEQREHVTLVATDLAGLASVTRADGIRRRHVPRRAHVPPREPRRGCDAWPAGSAPGGIVSIAARNGDAMAWRPAGRHDWAGRPRRCSTRCAARPRRAGTPATATRSASTPAPTRSPR